MTLQSFLAAAKTAGDDVESFLAKVYKSLEGTPAMKNLETLTVEALSVAIKGSVAALVPAPFSVAVEALVQQLATQVEAEISAQAAQSPNAKEG